MGFFTLLFNQWFEQHQQDTVGGSSCRFLRGLWDIPREGLWPISLSSQLTREEEPCLLSGFKPGFWSGGGGGMKGLLLSLQRVLKAKRGGEKVPLEGGPE